MLDGVTVGSGVSPLLDCTDTIEMEPLATMESISCDAAEGERTVVTGSRVNVVAAVIGRVTTSVTVVANWGEVLVGALVLGSVELALDGLSWPSH